jgi:RHS repeat-associated protein
MEVICPTANHQLSTVGTLARSYDSVGSTARTYDNDGNTTAIGTSNKGTVFTFDDRGRMRTVTVANKLKANYRYNGRGERVLKTDAVTAANSEQFVYDEAGHLLGEYDKNGTRIKEYAWLEDTLIAILGSFDGTTYQYVETDHLGTPRAVVQPVKNVIVWRWDLNNTAFGEHAPNANPDGDSLSYTLNLRYPGQYYDAESGLYHNGFRDYDAGGGRYIESDPIGLAGGVSTFGYVGGKPFQFSDPRGLLSFNDILDMNNVNGFIYDHSGHASVSQGVVDGVNGFANGASFGLSNAIERAADIDGGVNECSDSYRYSKYAGWAWGAGTFWAGGLNGGSASVFYAGTGARALAFDAGITIDQTLIGSILDSMGAAVPKPLWKLASATFAANATEPAGSVILYVAPSSIWNLEARILAWRGISVVGL